MREMAAYMEEAMAVADAGDHPLWPAAMRRWRSFAAFLAGDHRNTR